MLLLSSWDVPSADKAASCYSFPAEGGKRITKKHITIKYNEFSAFSQHFLKEK